MPVPQILPAITLILTHNCNMDCPYCFDRFSGGGCLEYATAVQRLRSFAGLHKRFRVVFFGGEPLLEFPLLEKIVGFCEKLCAEAAAEHISYSITTNGILMDGSMARFFNEHDFDVTLSVDGVFSESLHQVIGAPCKILRPELIPVYAGLKSLHVRVTVYPHTVSHIRDLYIELLSLEPSAIAFSPVVDDAFQFTKMNELNWKRQLEDVIYFRVSNSCGCMIDTIDAMANAVVRRFSMHYGCSAGAGSFAVDVNGGRYPCHRFVGKKRQLCMGAELHRKAERKCPGCRAYGICGGFCDYCLVFAQNSTLELLCSCQRKRAELACWLALLKRKAINGERL